MKLKNCQQDVSPILNKIIKPITYTGNEVNSVHKDLDKIDIRFALAFPDIYEVGMSHIGLKILYGLLNEQEDIWAERTFAPWIDMEEKMLENGIPLYCLESMDPVKNFDFIGFSLQYEMSYTNLLNMLSLAHIPILSKDRQEGDPFVIAGGPCTYNPEPLADFIDIFIIGEAEEALLELMDVYREFKKSDQPREIFLKQAANIEGVYIPRFYNVEYNGNQTIKSFQPNNANAKPVINRRFIKDIENVYYPENYVVSYTETVHDRISYEIFRGCANGCRFCQAGQIYRPVREKSLERIKEDIYKLIETTGYDEVSLSSLSSGDYSKIQELISDLMEHLEDEKVSVLLPSLRIDSLSIEMLDELKKVRKGGITLAPEAGSQRLRDVINKNVTEEDLLSTVQSAFRSGWGRVKLYFMIGLPTENDEDVKAINKISEKVVDEFYKVDKKERNRSVNVVISTSCFVPKPFTAFQWAGQLSPEAFRERINLLKDEVKSKRIKYNWHEPELSFLEACFARGDRRLGKVLKRAWELGCRFDDWSEHFDYDKWLQAFKDCEINPEFYASRQRDFDEILPWDFIDIGVSKDYLRLEWEKSLVNQTSTSCLYGCEKCGILDNSSLEFNENTICFKKKING